MPAKTAKRKRPGTKKSRETKKLLPVRRVPEDRVFELDQQVADLNRQIEDLKHELAQSGRRSGSASKLRFLVEKVEVQQHTQLRQLESQLVDRGEKVRRLETEVFLERQERLKADRQIAAMQGEHALLAKESFRAIVTHTTDSEIHLAIEDPAATHCISISKQRFEPDLKLRDGEVVLLHTLCVREKPTTPSTASEDDEAMCRQFAAAATELRKLSLPGPIVL